MHSNPQSTWWPITEDGGIGNTANYWPVNSVRSVHCLLVLLVHCFFHSILEKTLKRMQTYSNYNSVMTFSNSTFTLWFLSKFDMLLIWTVKNTDIRDGLNLSETELQTGMDLFNVSDNSQKTQSLLLRLYTIRADSVALNTTRSMYYF